MRSVIADATNEAYAVRIAKGAGLIAETRELLRAWQPGESAAVLAERVLKTDLLGKSTARRVKDIVQRVFAPRYLYPAGCPAVYLKRLVERHTTGDWFRDLCLLYTARANRLVRDSVTVLLRNARDEGRIALSVDAVVAFLREADQNGMMAHPWSPVSFRQPCLTSNQNEQSCHGWHSGVLPICIDATYHSFAPSRSLSEN